MYAEHADGSVTFAGARTHCGCGYKMRRILVHRKTAPLRRICGWCNVKASRHRYATQGRVQWAVQKALRSGELLPLRHQYCVDCGAPATEYDHRDYSKPIEVDPVCHRCNKLRGPALLPPPV